mmetsp:Transcript_34213/g.91675  ORF Transcript_34213/g.91675 Transcript_34213/m.91675 type:complete len:216 (+) Transcript_34213:82-729(+)
MGTRRWPRNRTRQRVRPEVLNHRRREAGAGLQWPPARCWPRQFSSSLRWALLLGRAPRRLGRTSAATARQWAGIHCSSARSPCTGAPSGACRAGARSVSSTLPQSMAACTARDTMTAACLVVRVPRVTRRRDPCRWAPFSGTPSSRRRGRTGLLWCVRHWTMPPSRMRLIPSPTSRRSGRQNRGGHASRPRRPGRPLVVRGPAQCIACWAATGST